MRDIFFEDEKRAKGISVTVFVVTILVIALLSSVLTYCFMPTVKIDSSVKATPPVASTTPRTNIFITGNGVTEDVFTQIYAENCDMVVIIDAYIIQNGSELHYSQSSGFIISEDGYILTNTHCVADMDRVDVTLYNGEKYVADIVGSDDRTDVAVIKIKPEKQLKTANIGNSDNIKIGQYAIAIGNPMGYEYSMSIGFVSGLERTVDSNNYRYKMIQVDTPLNSGNSGGPLLNSKGEVIGINTMKSSSSGIGAAVEGMGFAIPINIAMEISQQLISDGKVTRPAIQASVGNYSGPNGGVIVAEVTEGGASEKAGILPNDIIIGFNGASIKTVNDLMEQLEYCKSGDEVEIIIIRDGSTELKLKIILGTT